MHCSRPLKFVRSVRIAFCFYTRVQDRDNHIPINPRWILSNLVTVVDLHGFSRKSTYTDSSFLLTYFASSIELLHTTLVFSFSVNSRVLTTSKLNTLYKQTLVNRNPSVDASQPIFSFNLPTQPNQPQHDTLNQSLQIHPISNTLSSSSTSISIPYNTFHPLSPPLTFSPPPIYRCTP